MMKHAFQIRHVLIAAGFLMVGASGHAQVPVANAPDPAPAQNLSPQDEILELKKIIGGLTDRLGKLEKVVREQQQKPQPEPAPPPAATGGNAEAAASKPKPAGALLDSILGEKKAKPPQLENIYDEGFWFVGPHDKLKMGAILQIDDRYFLGGSPGDDTFQIRRARLYATGVLGEKWGYMLMPRWDRGTAGLHFAWIESQHLPWMRVRVGQFKEPYSLEGVNSDLYLDFDERSTWVANMVQIEDIGAMIYGKLFDEHVEYGVGAFNGRGKDRSDTNDEKEISAQLTFVPFRTSNEELLQDLYISFSGSVSKMEDDLRNSSFQTGAQTPFLTFAGGVDPQGDKERASAEIEWFAGPASVRGGAHHGRLNDLHLGSTQADFNIEGWTVSASWLLTGEDKPRNKPVKPKADFNPAKDGWGAFELATRYDVFEADPQLVRQGFATGTTCVNTFTVGFNWYFNKNMVLKLDYQNASFAGPVVFNGESVVDENTLTGRMQLEF